MDAPPPFPLSEIWDPPLPLSPSFRVKGRMRDGTREGKEEEEGSGFPTFEKKRGENFVRKRRRLLKAWSACRKVCVASKKGGGKQIFETACSFPHYRSLFHKQKSIETIFLLFTGKHQGKVCMCFFRIFPPLPIFNAVCRQHLQHYTRK